MSVNIVDKPIVTEDSFQGIPVRIVTVDGMSYIPLVDIARGISYERNTLRHLYERNLNLLKKHSRDIVMTSGVAPSSVVCLTRDGVFGVLMKLDYNRITDSVKKDKIIEFQNWAIDKLSAGLKEEFSKARPVNKLETPLSPLAEMHLLSRYMLIDAGVDPEIATAVSLVEMHRQLGMDPSRYIKSLPPVDPKPAYLTPTEIGKRYDVSAVEINKLLEKEKLQENVCGKWQCTESGKLYCASFPGATSVWSGYQLKWSEEAISRILRHLDKTTQKRLL